MHSGVVAVTSFSTSEPVVHIALAIALGLLLGLEREWSQKAAGIRTFALISVLGVVFTSTDQTFCVGVNGTASGGTVVTGCLPILTLAGAGFVTVVAAVLMQSGLADAEEGLHLTTAVSLLVAYGVGVLVAVDQILPATVVAVTSSLLLVFKRELHGFAWGLSRKELRSTSEFAILAFVVYPLLPAGSVTVGEGLFAVEFEPRIVWLMVVFVAGIGIVNYAIVETYGGRGIAVTGFFGGLASSTAVVGTMLDHVQQRPDATGYAVAAILLADAAMAIRNVLIALVFTLSVSRQPLLGVVVPLGAVVVGSLVIAALTADWSETVDVDLESPFSMQNALGFGALFLFVVALGSVAGAQFGQLGFYATTALTGLVSSAGATTSAVVLYRNGSLTYAEAITGVVVATGASVVVKGALAATSPNRDFARKVVVWSTALLVLAVAASAVVVV